ncbi:MAG: response regulator [Deltaproteobacteria bacterium]|nr:MAG: response regulator [Deltaproteobacteria bacterium]
MRQLVVFALRRIPGCHCDEADDGVEALKKLNAGTYDLLVTDINMPIMDGLKLVGMVRKDARHTAMPIVIITTEGGAEDRQRALSLGANAYITKPIRAQQVVEVVSDLLEAAGA